jgi:hypothetical protein
MLEYLRSPLTHEDAVAWWKFAEDIFFVCFVSGLCMMTAAASNWRKWGVVLALGTWIIWIVAYDIAEGFRNVNQ